MSKIFLGKWWAIAEPTEYSGAAAYAVRLVRRGRVERIARFRGVDPEGIVTIGMTKHLDQRRKEFNSGYKTGHGHSAANLLHPLKQVRGHKLFFREATFQIWFEPISDPKKARRRETDLTHQYWKRYGEAPPLTSAMGDRYAYLKAPKI